MEKELKDTIDEWVSLVRKSSLGSIAGLTPPGRRNSSKNYADARSRAKKGIATLKARILKRWQPVEAYPRGKNGVYTKFNEEHQI